MSDTPQVYRSTDPGAPVLTGQAGKLVDLLDAVLVNGYGSGGDAKAPLGWTIAFTGTNKRVYRNDPTDYSGFYLRFDDAASQFALVNGYESMSDIDTGVRAFSPSNYAYGKSSTANTTAREWMVVGTARCFYLFIKSNGSDWLCFFLGDMFPMGDAEIGICAITSSGSTSAYINRSGFGAAASTCQVFVSRSVDGSPAATECRLKPMLFSNQNNWGGGGFPYPLPSTGGLLISRAFAAIDSVSSNSPRFCFPGLWLPEHNMLSYFSHGHVFSDVEGLPDTELLLVEGHATTDITLLLDITNAWVP